MPQASTPHSACWEITADGELVEGLLSRIRRENPGLIIQVLATSRAPNPAMVEMVAAQTLAAAKSGSTLAERPELDLLLRLAGTKQIGEAFRRAGYRSGGKKLFLVAAAEGNGAALKRLGKRLARDGSFAEVPRKKLTGADLDLVERAALLAAGL